MPKLHDNLIGKTFLDSKSGDKLKLLGFLENSDGIFTSEILNKNLAISFTWVYNNCKLLEVISDTVKEN